MSRRFLALAACVAALAASARFAPTITRATGRDRARPHARLVAGAPGEAGVEVRLAPGAITYWRDPGDAGRAAALRLCRLAQSRPRRTRLSGAQPHRRSRTARRRSAIRTKSVFPIAVAAADASKPVELALQFDYAVCEKLCIPAKATLKLTLPSVGASPYAATLAAARAEAPRPTRHSLRSAANYGARRGRLAPVRARRARRRARSLHRGAGRLVADDPADANAKDRACFAIALQQKPSDATLAGRGPRDADRRRGPTRIRADAGAQRLATRPQFSSS